MSAISRDEVARLAKLARLALTDTELDSFAGQLDAILGHVGQVQAVDVTDVKPTGNPLKVRRAGAERLGDEVRRAGAERLGDELVNVFRPDSVEPCLTQEQALDQAPKSAEERFAVPRILGEQL